MAVIQSWGIYHAQGERAIASRPFKTTTSRFFFKWKVLVGILRFYLLWQQRGTDLDT
jgi:hypothetical protein